jgi:outer membrane lipoprotein LolB
LSVRVEEAKPRSVTAAFELRGTARSGQLDLNSPLGNVMARASWTPEEVLLVTPDGSARFDDLDALGREVLGESLPMAALFDWLHGRPWPDAPSAPIEGGRGFEQLGWKVDLAGFDAGSIVATRDAPPAVMVRARVER